MRAYWQQLNEREQTIVMFAGVGLSVYLLYALVFAPLSEAVTQAQMNWHSKTNTLSWLRRAQQNYNPSQKPQRVAASNLLSILTAVLKQTSFHHFPYQLAQTTSGEIQLNFEEVPYNAFTVWLRNQTARYTLTIKNMEVTKTPVPGVVKVSVVFAVS